MSIGGKKILEAIDRELQFQESNLSNTRNTHYVYQGLLLGVEYVSIFAIITIMSTSDIIFRSIEDDNQNAPYGVAAVLLLIMAILSSFVICWLGNRLLDETSERVQMRGRIVDLIQHLKVLDLHGRLDAMLAMLPSRMRGDKIFAIVKVAEGIELSSDIRKKQKDYYIYRRPHFLGNKDSIFGDQKELIERLAFIMYKSDILSISDDSVIIPEKDNILRKSTPFRTGHKRIFNHIWSIAEILLVVISIVFALRFVNILGILFRPIA